MSQGFKKVRGREKKIFITEERIAQKFSEQNMQIAHVSL